VVVAAATAPESESVTAGWAGMMMTAAAELVDDDAVSELLDTDDEAVEVAGVVVPGVVVPGGGVTTPESGATPKSWVVGWSVPSNTVFTGTMVTMR
jgi:hypothetical protein